MIAKRAPPQRISRYIVVSSQCVKTAAAVKSYTPYKTRPNGMTEIRIKDRRTKIERKTKKERRNPNRKKTRKRN